MVKILRRHISRHLTNLGGWSTNRKFVVIESDDWGSIRMPSREVYNQCLKAGYQVDKIAYERYDSLASEEDLELLFQLLSAYKDYRGRSPVITANILTANPDFQRILSSGFQEYYYELITETFKQYPKHSNCFNLWQTGKQEGIFYPQSHGREHLNVSKFMEALREGDEDAHFGFKHRMPGCMPRGQGKGGNKYVESLRYCNHQDKQEKLLNILEGLELFESLMGYQSKTFIPPNYLWSPDFDAVINSAGVDFYQGQRKMKEPSLVSPGSIRFNMHKMGEENFFGQRYLVRNAFFEPSLSGSDKNSVNHCLKDISVAFRMKKPAIICSHRLNYVGYLDIANRDRNLKLLESLLGNVIRLWPDVEFVSSAELGEIMITINE